MTSTRPDDRDEQLLDDLQAGLRTPTPPASLERRMHEAIDAGFLDPPARRRRWPLVAAAAAFAAAASVAAVLWLRPPAPDPTAWQPRGADMPLAVEMRVLSVSADGESTTWVRPGDTIDENSWLRFQLQTPPGVHLALARRGPDGELDLFYRWPDSTPAADRVSRDGDVWYSVEGIDGEHTFGCVASDRRLPDDQVAVALTGGTGDEDRLEVENIAVRIE
jgi:hypothetical protein